MPSAQQWLPAATTNDTTEKVVCIEQRNNNNCAQIVNNGQRHQENLQRSGNPIPQQRQYAQREGNIGGCRNRPPFLAIESWPLNAR